MPKITEIVHSQTEDKIIHFVPFLVEGHRGYAEAPCPFTLILEWEE